jgi:hypothetical protein
MIHPWFVRRLAVLTLVAAATSTLPAQAQTQTAPRRLIAIQAPSTPAPTGLDLRRAEDLRNELRELMRQYPPALGRVLKLDSSLMTNADYLAPYPSLAAFLQAHPEVARYPDYFLNFIGEGGWADPLDAESRVRIQAVQAQGRMLESLTIMTVVGAIVLGVLWLARLFVSHRRWIRATRMQSELNNRLLERLGNNEQLLAYLQSQPGHQLTTVPVVSDLASPAEAAPFGRILWAVQAGLVSSSAGIGLLIIKQYVLEEAGLMLLTFGVLAIALGAGFALASYASYILSQRFGLLDGPRGGSGDTSGA